MEEATYTYAGAAKILDIGESKLRYWAQTGFVGPSARRAGKQVFTFQDLVSIKAAKELVDRGFKAGQIRKALEAVRSSLPHVDRPLDRIRVTFDGDRLVVVDEGVAYETTGQRVFDFGLAELRTTAQNIAEVRPRTQTPVGTPAAAKRTAYDWFAEGTLRESAGDADADTQAETCYQKALALDAGLAAAHTNLGSIAHRRGDAAEARAAFERALAIDPESGRGALQPGEPDPRIGGPRARGRGVPPGACRSRPTSPTATTTSPSRWDASGGARRRARTSSATSAWTPAPRPGPPRRAP